MPIGKSLFGRLSLLLMGIGFAALLAASAGLVWQIETTRGYANAVSATQEVRVTAWRVLSLLQDAETGQRGFLLTGEDSYLAPYNAAVEALPPALDRLADRVLQDGGRLGPIAELRDIAAAKLIELDRTIVLIRAGERDQALAIIRSDAGKARMDTIREFVAGVELRSGRRLAIRSAGLEANGQALLIGAALAFALILAVTSGFSFLAFRYTRELEKAQAAVAEANAGLEARVAERTAALAAVNEEVQRFAYIVSHDLRAPLVNVMGFTAELEAALAPLSTLLAAAEAEAPGLVTPEARAAVAEDMPEAISFIRSSTERMDRLINAILRLSREGRRALKPEPVALDELFEGIAASLRHQLDAAGASIEIVQGLPRLRSDRLALEQLFGNLIDNAVKYLDPARPGRITIRAWRQAGRVRIEVADNGRGIDPRDHARVFELFRRSGRQDRPGEGIGLAHVRALARRLGGEVTLDSTPGAGARFQVTLPPELPAMSTLLPEEPAR